MKKKQPRRSAIDKAFTDSDKHTLADLKLQPWTPERIMHAQTIGLRWPNIGKEGDLQFIETKVYPGASSDLSIFLLLSTLDKTRVELATREDAKAFGIKRGLHNTDSIQFWDAYNKFFEVQRQILDSATKQKGVVGKEPEDDDPND